MWNRDSLTQNRTAKPFAGEMHMNDKILSYAEAGQVLNRDPKTIKRWVSSGKIPAVYLRGSPNALGLRLSTVYAILGNENKDGTPFAETTGPHENSGVER